MRNHGIGSWSARRARKSPRRLAVVHQDNRYTYAQLHERSTRLAHHLRSLGVGRGDRIAFLGPNHPAFLETMFAAGLLGAVFVPLNIRLSEPELRHCLTDSGTSLLVHAASFDAASFDVAAAASGIGRCIALGDGYERALAHSPDTPIDERVGPDDAAMIMYTSGTTGRAKGAVLSHGNLTWNSINTVVDGDFASDEVTLVCAPMFHTAALNMNCLPTILKGGTLVLEEAFSPSRTLDLIEEHRVTVMFGVPVMFQEIARQERFPHADLSSVRRMMCGGAPVPAALIHTYARRGLRFVQGYGMTEASPGVCLLDEEHALDKAGSAGLPHFFTDVRIVDPAGANAERGELIVEGPNVMSGYWGRPEETSAVLQDGWLRTGDVAVADEDGFVTIVDRVKDMIISGGENVYPAEVENLLAEHPAVRDCAVIGVPDERWGEAARAVVVREPDAEATAEDLLAFLDGRLARYKIPKSVVFTGDPLPRTGAGKLRKPLIREMHGTIDP